MQLEDLGKEGGIELNCSFCYPFLVKPTWDVMGNWLIRTGLGPLGGTGNFAVRSERAAIRLCPLSVCLSLRRAECGRSWGLHFNYSPHCVSRRASLETLLRIAIDILHYNSASESPCFDVPVVISAADGWTDQCAAVIQSVTRAAS